MRSLGGILPRLLLLLGVMVSGAPEALQAGTQPLPSRANEKNIRYGTDPLNTLDIFYDNNLHDAPIILDAHGGGWQFGDKAEPLTPVFSTFFNDLGFVYVRPNYRLSAQGNTFPTQINDVACALAWVKHHAAQYGADQSNVIVMGGSAGAHITAMIAYDGEANWLNGCSTQGESLAVRGFMGESGVYDFDLIQGGALAFVQAFLGTLANTNRWSVAEPINFVSGGDPPALLIHGDQDLYVNFHQSINFAQALQAHNIPVTLNLRPGLRHAQGLSDFATNADLRAQVAAFVTSVVSPPPPRGDLDGDGRVTLADARLMLQMLLGQAPADVAKADLNHDGSVSLADLRFLLQLL